MNFNYQNPKKNYETLIIKYQEKLGKFNYKVGRRKTKRQ